MADRVRLDIAYDGAGFVGWARQPGLRSVQGELEAALTTVLRLAEPVTLTVAGRTDAGVHARGQVAHVDLPAGQLEQAVGRSGLEPLPALRRRLAGVLDDDVVVRHVSTPPPGFDARFSAIWRRYSYRVVDDVASRDPLRARAELWHPRTLDAVAMQEAAALLLGEHDFLAFCKPREGASTVRELLDLRWQRHDGVLHCDVVADAFCHSMVRSLVGASLAVGEGRWQPERPAELLAAGRRDSAITVAPAHPLVLEEVGYPARSELAQRAAVARNIRGPIVPVSRAWSGPSPG